MKSEPSIRGQRNAYAKSASTGKYPKARSPGHSAVSVGKILNYEHGRTRTPTDRIEQLAPALRCEPVELLMPPGSPLPRYRRS